MSLHLFALVFFSIGEVSRAAATFTPLGVDFATGVSGDGSVVVGTRHGRLNQEPYRWTRREGVVPLLQFPPGYEPHWSHESTASAVSLDGSTIVGTQNFPDPYYGWRWRADTGMTLITGRKYFAEAVSGDGSVIVGWTQNSNFPGWRWTANEGLVDLSDQVFYAVSGDGSVFAGGGVLWSGAVLWSEQTGTVVLGDLPGGRDYSFPRAISADGTTVVGTSSSSDGILDTEAFRWTAATGMVGLGDLPGGSIFASVGQGVSGDGSIVVGWSRADFDVPVAFLWTEELGMVNFRDYLISQGVDNLAGWTLTEATAISADGQTIVGTGTNPLGGTEAWVATIPEPSMIVLAAIGVVSAIVFFARRATQHG